MEIPSSSIPPSSPLSHLHIERDDDQGCMLASPKYRYSPSSSASFDHRFAADAMTVPKQDKFAAQQARVGSSDIERWSKNRTKDMRCGTWRTGWIHRLGSVYCVMSERAKVGR
jgi:hypothetical protein